MANQPTLRILPKPANDVEVEVGSERSPRSPIDLRIHGADILISGHFHRWQATTTMGRDLDELSVRMAVDVTSPDQLIVDSGQPDLFSFRSNTILEVRSNLYLARGELVTPAGGRRFEMVVEAPEGPPRSLLCFLVCAGGGGGRGGEERAGGGGGGGGGAGGGGGFPARACAISSSLRPKRPGVSYKPL